MAEKLASVVLDYGPYKVPVDLYGVKEPVTGLETYEYGVLGKVKGLDLQEYKAEIFFVANGPYAFGLKRLYLPDEDVTNGL